MDTQRSASIDHSIPALKMIHLTHPESGIRTAILVFPFLDVERRRKMIHQHHHPRHHFIDIHNIYLWVLTGAALIALVSVLLVVLERTNSSVTPSSVAVPQSYPLAYDATGAMVDAIVFPTYSDQLRVMPVQPGLAYDATGAMLSAVVLPTYNDQLRIMPAQQGLAYDATGAMLNAVVLPTYNGQLRVMPVKQGLVYDATGAMLEAVVFPKYPDR
jgi:hypothetical protein